MLSQFKPLVPAALRARLRPFIQLTRRGWRKTVAALPAAARVRQHYRQRNGFPPNLFQPRDLSEKLCWTKLYGVTLLHQHCSDKLAVRDFVRDRGGGAFLVPLHQVVADAAAITPDMVRAGRFVLKTNHDAGTVIICRNRDRFDWRAARETLAAALARDFSTVWCERQYERLPRRILVEHLIDTADGRPPRDFKLFCFSGRPRLVQVDVDRFEHHAQAFYDTDWQRMEIRRNKPVFQGEVPRPRRLGEMLSIAARLSAPFQFCRVDLFETPDGIRFSELTFTPDAGMGRFQPPSFERMMGDLFGPVGGDCKEHRPAGAGTTLLKSP